jgi:hypothetical protein
MGLALILALVTWGRGSAPQGPERRPVVHQGLVRRHLLIIYLPLKFQVTLLNGFEFPGAGLATWGRYPRVIPYLQERLARRRASGSKGAGGGWVRHWLPILLLLAVLPTNLYLEAWRVLDLGRHDYPYYLGRDDVAALDWLDENVTPDDVVLSSFTIGHYLPGMTGARAFLSNAVMTMDY